MYTRTIEGEDFGFAILIFYIGPIPIYDALTWSNHLSIWEKATQPSSKPTAAIVAASYLWQHWKWVHHLINISMKFILLFCEQEPFWLPYFDRKI